MVSSDIPSEIWLKVVAQLDPKDLASLLPVNRQLMNIARDALYRRCIIAGEAHRQFSPFPLLRPYDFITHRVQELVFGHDPEESYILPSWMPPFTLKFCAKRQEFKKLLEGVSQLESLRSITFEFNGRRSSRQIYVSQKMQIFRACATTWRHNITHIYFRCHLYLLAPGWPAGITFPNLVTLDIEFLTQSFEINSVKRPALPKFFVPFINDHRDTLSELRLRLSPYRWSCPSPILVLQQLGRLKKLRKICMEHDTGSAPVQEPLPVIQRFLQNHAFQLVDLEVWMPEEHIYVDGTLNAWLSQPLPKLRRLHVSGPLNEKIEGRITKWLGRQTDSQLESLTILFVDTYLDRVPVYPSTVVPYLLQRNVIFGNLTNLNMDIGTFSVDMLVDVSMTFPRLQILSFQKFQLTKHSVVKGTLSANYVASVLDGWGLEDISLTPIYPRLFEPETKRYIVEILANVVWFCGMSGKDWIDDNSVHVDHEYYDLPLAVFI